MDLPNPVLVEQRRGDYVESWHRGAALVVNADQGIAWSVGQIGRPVLAISALKLVQALPFIATGAADRWGCSDAEIVLAASSHSGRRLHRDALRAWLARLGLEPSQLLCGATEPHDRGARAAIIRRNEKPTVFHKNSLGKHIGVLATCLHLGEPLAVGALTMQKHFTRFAGAAVVLLGLMNIQAGIVLTSQGPTASGTQADVTGSDGTAVAESSEPQRIALKVIGLDYQPHQFTVKVGRPVQWWIDGSEAEGCGRLLIAPQLGIRKILSDTSTTLISFTPTRTGEFQFNCGMGMMTPDSKTTVVGNDKG